VAGQQARFGDQMRRYREAAGFSQEELAARAGMSVNAIGALERGERKRPYPDTIRRLAEALALDDAARLALAASLHGTPVDEPTPPVATSTETTPAELPGEPTPLIGRARETGVVRHLLAHADGRLLTLIGPGGVGKTRLALHLTRMVANEYAGGVVWVEMAPLSDPALLIPTIGRAIGIEEPAQGDPAAAVRAWLRNRQVLLVLDNLEHLPGAGQDVAHLLSACPQLRILATSRSPLRIRGEQEYLVPPLELPTAEQVRDPSDVAAISSVQFFVWQAQQKVPTFALTSDNAPIVAAICRRLDGLPLALELVAARIRVLGPAELLARLDHQMPLLVGGARDLPQRQQTMRAAIDWSYTLLEPEVRLLFRRLAVFAGGWTLDAAEAVTDGEAMFDLLDLLVEQSLVTVSPNPDETRYGMLEPIRQFALDRLEEEGEAEATQRRHAIHFQDLAERAARELEGRSGQFAWLQRLEREHDNLRAALAWSEQAPEGNEIGLRLASSLWRFWEMRWYVDEGSTWLDRTLARSDGLSPALRASALSAAGNLARDRTDHDLATRYHEQSLAIRRQLGDTRGIAVSLNNLGVIARDLKKPEETLILGRESLALFRSAGDQHGTAIALIGLGKAASQLGDDRQAREYYEECLALFRASGDDWHTAWVLNYLAELVVGQGDLVVARSVAEEALAMHQRANDVWGTAAALTILGKVDQAEHNLDGATRRFAHSLRLLVGSRIERAVPAGLDDLAGVLLAIGEDGHAAWLAGAAESLRAAGQPSDASIPGMAPDLSGLRDGPQATVWQMGRASTREQVYARSWEIATVVAPEPPGNQR
jgi:predicted ATPase/transcriptional regulator with XRE-family HTH domain